MTADRHVDGGQQPDVSRMKRYLMEHFAVSEADAEDTVRQLMVPAEIDIEGGFEALADIFDRILNEPPAASSPEGGQDHA